MAHEITTRDNLFTVRQPAWHGLGEVLPEYPTKEEAKAIAHPWEPVSEPLYRAVPYFDEDGMPATRYEEVTGHVANVRSDDGYLLGVTSETYQLVGNAEMYEIAEALESEAGGDVMYETGGSLKGGAKVWLLLRLKEPLQIGQDQFTATIPYYSLQNSHDGTSAFRGQATMTRIVCDNTAQMADLDAQQRGTEFVFHHTLSIHQRIEEAKTALKGWRESIETYQMMSAHLLNERVSEAGARDFMERFIPEPVADVISDRVRNNIDRARSEWWGIYNGETNESITGTAYGLVQASVEYLNHVRKSHTAETKFQRAYLKRDMLTAKAVEMAQEAALV